MNKNLLTAAVIVSFVVINGSMARAEGDQDTPRGKPHYRPNEFLDMKKPLKPIQRPGQHKRQWDDQRRRLEKR